MLNQMNRILTTYIKIGCSKIKTESLVFHAMPYANVGYINQNCVICGLDYTRNGDRQNYF